jgi:hypothetical protein
LEPAEVGESFVVSGGDLLTAGDEFGKSFELAAAEGALEIGDAIVVTEFLHLVIPGAALCERRR